MRHRYCAVLAAALAATAFAGGSVAAPDEEPASNALEEILQAGPSTEDPLPLSSITNASVTLAVTPVYPKSALKKKIDGQVTLGFDISKHGRAENITVVAEDPPGVFSDAAVDAMKYWAFAPAQLATCGTVPQPARQTLIFDHDGDPQIGIAPLVVNDVPQPPQAMEETTLARFRQEQAAAHSASQIYDSRSFIVSKRVEPEYPLRALERRKEGMVALAFVIETDGSVGDVEVVDTVAGTYFQRPSLSAIRQWKFRPRMRNGHPVPSVACHEFVFHADEYERSGKLSRYREDSNIRSYGLD